MRLRFSDCLCWPTNVWYHCLSMLTIKTLLLLCYSPFGYPNWCANLPCHHQDLGIPMKQSPWDWLFQGCVYTLGSTLQGTNISPTSRHVWVHDFPQLPVNGGICIRFLEGNTPLQHSTATWQWFENNLKYWGPTLPSRKRVRHQVARLAPWHGGLYTSFESNWAWGKG